MPDQKPLAVTEDVPQAKQPWHPPQMEKAEINHDTASTCGSSGDGSQGSQNI